MATRSSPSGAGGAVTPLRPSALTAEIDAALAATNRQLNLLKMTKALDDDPATNRVNPGCLRRALAEAHHAIGSMITALHRCED